MDLETSATSAFINAAIWLTFPKVAGSQATLTSSSSAVTASGPKERTLMTGMTLFSCFSTCSRMWSSPWPTMVMRDMVGSSVVPTARLSML